MTTITATELILRECLSCKAKQVYIYLAHRSNRENTCFPGLKRIAKECSISISSVQRAINELVSEGLLKKLSRHRIDGSQTTNLYVLIEALEEKALAREEAIKAKKEKLHKCDQENQLKMQDVFVHTDYSNDLNSRHEAMGSDPDKDGYDTLPEMTKAPEPSLHIYMNNQNICRPNQSGLKRVIDSLINKSENKMIEFQLKVIKSHLKHISAVKKSLKFQHLNRGGIHIEQPDNLKRLTVFTFRK